MPCGNEVKDWSQVAASPGTPNGARKPPKAQRGEGGSRPGPSEGARPSRHPDFRLPAPGAVTASRLLFLAPRHVVLRYGRPGELGRKEPCLGWEDGCDDPPGLSQGGSAGLPSPRQAGSDGLARCTAQSHCVFASLQTGVLLWANGSTTVLKPSFPVQLAVGSGLFGSRNVRACRHSQRQSSPPPAGHPDSRSGEECGGWGAGGTWALRPSPRTHPKFIPTMAFAFDFPQPRQPCPRPRSHLSFSRRPVLPVHRAAYGTRSPSPLHVSTPLFCSS